MRRRFFLCLGFLILFATAIWPQEGHPLSGSWHGEWHPKPDKKVPVLIFMQWNSKAVEGAINPGRNAAPLKMVDLNAENWTVHLEADTKDGKHIVIDGKLADIGSYHRTITGTWSEGDAKGDFKITRD